MEMQGFLEGRKLPILLINFFFSQTMEIYFTNFFSVPFQCCLSYCIHNGNIWGEVQVRTERGRAGNHLSEKAEVREYFSAGKKSSTSVGIHLLICGVRE